MTKKYKNIPVKPETHQKLEALGRKGQSFDDVVAELLRGEPFVNSLKPILQNAIDKVEKAKKRGGIPDSAARSAIAELIRTCQWLIKECEVRSTDKEPNMELGRLRLSVKHSVDSLEVE